MNLGSQEIKGVSLADQVREILRNAILEGAIPPNEKITIERVAAQLGISRTPVREALKALEGDGLIQLMPRRGAVVVPYAIDEVVNQYTIAAMLEGLAAELSCRRHGPGLGARLQANCAEFDRTSREADLDSIEDVKKIVTLNYEFHDLIRRESGSTTLMRILESLRRPTTQAYAYFSKRESHRIASAYHHEIAQAFLDNDSARARKLAEKHLLDARDKILKPDH